MDIGVIGGIIFLAILVFVIIFELRKSSNKKAVSEFLNGLGEEIYNVVIDTIRNADPSLFKDVEAFEAAIISNIYDNVWDYVEKVAIDSLEVDTITKAVFKCIDKKTIVKFIDAILENKEGYTRIRDAYGAYQLETSNVESEDAKLVEEYADQSQYVEESKNEDLEAATEVEPTAEELAVLNPPKEEEDDKFNVEDDTMELITDKPEIITSYDKNGNALYYEVDANGKKTRVSKAYALSKMNQ